jgi:hypothetical protein
MSYSCTAVISVSIPSREFASDQRQHDADDQLAYNVSIPSREFASDQRRGKGRPQGHRVVSIPSREFASDQHLNPLQEANAAKGFNPFQGIRL